MCIRDRNAAISLIIAFALMFLTLLVLRKIFGADDKVPEEA